MIVARSTVTTYELYKKHRSPLFEMRVESVLKCTPDMEQELSKDAVVTNDSECHTVHTSRGKKLNSVPYLPNYFLSILNCASGVLQNSAKLNSVEEFTDVDEVQ